jgi:hypothetical protein
LFDDLGKIERKSGYRRSSRPLDIWGSQRTLGNNGGYAFAPLLCSHREALFRKNQFENLNKRSHDQEGAVPLKFMLRDILKVVCPSGTSFDPRIRPIPKLIYTSAALVNPLTRWGHDSATRAQTWVVSDVDREIPHKHSHNRKSHAHKVIEQFSQNTFH